MSSPWLDRRVIAFAHQGGSFEGPSSTLFAIRRALANGATAIELDVHATKDGRIVVCHDETVDRTTNHQGAIAQLTFAQLAEMDNAYWWIAGDAVTVGRSDDEYLHRGLAAGDRDFAIATLEEVVTAFPGVLLNLDIKQTAPQVESYEAILNEELHRLECRQSVIVASFLDAAIQRFRALAPDVATSAATEEAASFYFALVEGAAPSSAQFQVLQIPPTFGGINVVDERFVAAAHDAGVAVHVWTINDVDEMVRLLDLGVDGIVSDTPAQLVELLRVRSCAWDGVL